MLCKQRKYYLKSFHAISESFHNSRAFKPRNKWCLRRVVDIPLPHHQINKVQTTVKQRKENKIKTITIDQSRAGKLDLSDVEARQLQGSIKKLSSTGSEGPSTHSHSARVEQRDSAAAARPQARSTRARQAQLSAAPRLAALFGETHRNSPRPLKNSYTET